MKVFLQGGFFGLLFSSMAIWVLKFSPWAVLPDLRLGVFIIGGTLMGGLFHLLMMGKMRDVSSE